MTSAGWQVIRQLVRPRLGALAWVGVLFTVQSLTVLVTPMVIGSLIDAVGTPTGVVWGLVAALAGLAVVIGALTWASATQLAKTVEPMVTALRERLVTATLTLPRQSFEATGGGDLLARASSDITVLSEHAPTVLPRVVSISLSTLVIAAGMGAQDWRFLGVLIVVAPLLVLTFRWYGRHGPPTYRAERAAQATHAAHVLDTFRAEPTVRAFGLADRQVERIRQASWAHVRWEIRTRIVQTALVGHMGLIEGTGLAATLGLGTWLAIHGQASVGTVTAAALLYLQIMNPLAEFMDITDELQSGLAALTRVLEIITHTEGVAMAPTPGADPVALSAVSFSYHHTQLGGETAASPKVIHEVTCALSAGQHVAVVGATGSGKSTLALIVAGAFVPTRGRRTAGLAHTDIVMVTQETHVFAMTLRENLNLAAPDTGDEALLEAIESLGAGWLLRDCPEGLDTMLGVDGHQLSPATAQLLALVRCHLADPVLVILDEATAEAGSHDALALEAVAAQVMAGRSALVVAHRLSQAAACDHIIVMDHGRIVESGSHDDLVAQGGRYAKLWSIWNR